MNEQDEIIEMARQTGVLAGYEGEPSLLIIFAKALMGVEREACAKIVELNADACKPDGVAKMILDSNAAAIRARGEGYDAR